MAQCVKMMTSLLINKGTLLSFNESVKYSRAFSYSSRGLMTMKR